MNGYRLSGHRGRRIVAYVGLHGLHRFLTAGRGPSPPQMFGGTGSEVRARARRCVRLYAATPLPPHCGVDNCGAVV